jgi:polar amino acid transport system substrate-binding protein
MIFKIKILVFIIIILTQVAFATDKKKSLTIVRGDGYWPPYEWIENDKLVGLHIDLVKEVSKTLGLKVIITSYPWLRAINIIKKGQVDAILFIARKKDREEFVHYDERNELHISRTSLIVMKERLHEIKYSGDLKQLKKYTICGQQGFSYGKLFEQASYLTIDRGAITVVQLIEKLMHKRCDLAVGYDYVKEVARKKGFKHKFVELKPDISAHPMYIGFSVAKKNLTLAKRFAKAMKLFKTTDRYKQLLKKYNR